MTTRVQHGPHRLTDEALGEKPVKDITLKAVAMPARWSECKVPSVS